MEALGVHCFDPSINLFCWCCGATIVERLERAEATLRLEPDGVFWGGRGGGFYDCPWLIYSWRDGANHPVAQAIIRAEQEPDPDGYGWWREKNPIPNRYRRKDLLLVNILAYLQERFEYVSIAQMRLEARRWRAIRYDPLRPDYWPTVYLGRTKSIRTLLEKLIRAGLAEAKPDRRGIPGYRLIDPGLPSVKKCRRCNTYVERTMFTENSLGWCGECWRR